MTSVDLASQKHQVQHKDPHNTDACRSCLVANITKSFSVELKFWGSRVFWKLALLNIELLAAVSAVIVAINNWLGHI